MAEHGIEDENIDNVEENEVKSAKPKSKTPLLDNFGKDLTKLAAEGKMEPVIGRQDEIDQIIQILSRKKKSNPLCVGAPGVGKSAIVEGLALRIVNKQVSRILHDKRIFTLDLSSMVAGTKFRGQFEERMKGVIEELEQNPDIIIFIDEIHTLIGSGNSAGSMDGANMLKPSLARGSIKVIGATTFAEFKKSIETDKALLRRFQKVVVDEPSKEETLEILRQIKGLYEEHHNVTYSEESLIAAVEFADRYVPNMAFPDKAIDFVDSVGSSIHIKNMGVSPKLVELENKLVEIKKEKEKSVILQQYEISVKKREEELSVGREIELEKIAWLKLEKEKNRVVVTDEDVIATASKMTGIPVAKLSTDEGVRIMNMATELEKRVIGQDEAVKAMAEVIQRNKAGLNDGKKPIGVFLFLGSTGTGKTELAKALAEYLFFNEKALIKLNMSEYSMNHEVAKLIGSPPGFVAHDEGGQLTEKVKNQPYSVILLDEMEKGHHLVHNMFLQVFNDGSITSGKGEEINFKNTIIIMTSNVGASRSNVKHVGFDTPNEIERKVSIVQGELKKYFNPEFLNRIDETIVFNQLTEENIDKITEIHVNNFAKHVEKQGYKLNVSDEVKKLIAKEGYSPEFGARPILRMITKYLQTPISKELLLKKFSKGDTIFVVWDAKKEEIKVSKKK